MTSKEILEMAFREWLYRYEATETERWEHLTVSECDTLTLQQWHVFYCEYQNTKANNPEAPDTGQTQQEPVSQP